jgi:hypothetical protein
MPVMPAHASSTAAIPFEQPAAAPMPGSTGGLIVATVLLGAAFVVLWWLRRRGFGGVPATGAAERGGDSRLTVAQRLRLGPTCSAFVVHDGDARLLIVESRYGVQVSSLSPTEPAP